MKQEDTPETHEVYDVVVNHEGQYSVWRAGQPLPNGWRHGGLSGSKKECLEYIDTVWLDMRPLSSR